MKVKICGLTNLDDALAAVDAGAGLLGFNFYRPSPRYIEPATCATILERVRASTASVIICGVFVNACSADIEAVATLCGLDLIQLHGDEPPEILRQLGPAAFKAIRPQSPAEAQRSLGAYAGGRVKAPALLVDAYRPGVYGGTGAAGDWSVAARLAARVPILLAGGLTPRNVEDAITQVRPWGVDAASGVESEPGRKDHHKMAAFVTAARRAYKELPIADSNS